MDTQRSSFDGGDDFAVDAPGIEAPPMIGQDERRMHVRAYNFWAKLLEGRSFPSIEALDVDDLGDFGPNAVLLDFTSGIDNPSVVFVGPALARECDIDDEVDSFEAIPRRSLLSRLTDHYLQIIANRAPIGFEAEFVNARGLTILYRGVLLPFSSDDDTIDFIMGVINWKQAADEGLTRGIADEMEAAPPPPPPSRPTLPVWTDDSTTVAGFEEDDADLVALPTRSLIAAVPSPATEMASSMAGLIRPRNQPLLAAVPDAFDSDDEAIGDEDEDVLDLDTSFALSDDPPGSAEAPPPPYVLPAAVEREPAVAQVEAAPANDTLDLADWLASAREAADGARDANQRGHAALYQAIGRARGFAIAAAAAPGDYAELLGEAGIVPSARAPMTAVAKLVFGAGHDKTRLAEIAAVLGHAESEAISAAALPDYLARHDGGLKALLRTIRAASRPAATPAADPAAVLAGAQAFGSIDWPEAPDGGFVLLLARREADGTLSLIAASGEDDKATGRYMAQVARVAGQGSTQ